MFVLYISMAMNINQSNLSLWWRNITQHNIISVNLSLQNGFYALSIKHHLSVRHFNIDPEPSTNTYIMGTMKFDSIFKIIKYYQDNSLFLNNGIAVKLGQPVRQRSRMETSTRKS